MSEQPTSPPPIQETPSATPPPTDQTPMREEDARQWAMFCHLGALSHYIGIPFGGLIVPIVLWQMKKEDHPLINDQGKEAVNFQLTVLIAALICVPLVFVFCIGVFLAIALGVANIIFVILAGLEANKGVYYRYPYAIRFIK